MRTSVAIGTGSGRQTVSLGDTRIPVFTYRPAGCADPSLLLVFHGAERNAEDYRDYARGLADRIERRAGDLFGDLDARADIYTMKWILHDWSDDACRDILGRVRATMPSGSKLVTIDLDREPGRPNSHTSMMDLLMLVFCEGGHERSPHEVHALMRDAGLTPGRVRHSGFTMLVEGVAP